MITLGYATLIWMLIGDAMFFASVGFVASAMFRASGEVAQ
jgi:hypothetical protein